MKKHLLKKLSSFTVPIIFGMMFSVSANAQNVNIPNALFKSKLLNNPTINTNGDGQIQVTEAAAFTGTINVSATWPGPYISDLTGIEAFTALTGLDCSNNSIPSLDVSSNTALTSLNCRLNQLTSLDVSANTALTSLICDHNQLTSLDVSVNTALTTLRCIYNSLTSLDVSANTALTVLVCSNNSITTLDVSANTALTGLSCSSNQLAGLDVSTNTALTGLDCGYNSITSLDVSANTALTSLVCRYNYLTSLDVSANVALYSFYCLNNQISSLDVSTNPALVYFLCSNNQLTSLNVQNGNNANFVNFTATNNPNLTCIQVDNVANANSYVSFVKDATASYSTNCATGINDVSTLLNTFSIYPNPTPDNFTISLNSELKNAQMEIYNVLGDKVYLTTLHSKKETINNEFSSGIYFVKVNDGEIIYMQKLIVE